VSTRSDGGSGVASHPNSVGEAFPLEQQRVRELLDQYRSLDGMPGVNVKFAIAAIEQVVRRAEAAAMSGDIVAILRSYEELKGCE
jgi:predicted Ser/Thr protein kinase